MSLPDHGSQSATTESLPVVGSKRHTYKSLARGHIRLLKGQFENGQFIGTLQSFRLADPDLPAYDALSYTWGSQTYSEPILVDGEELLVLPSVLPFLGILAKRKPTYWWVDSICIDQKNKTEKAHQISLMVLIFRFAQQTQVYLGEEADDSTLAIEFLRDLGDRYGKRQSREWINATFQRKGPNEPQWDAVSKLFGRPWWTRIWTVQEYIIPVRLELYCGEANMSRENFVDALHCIWQGSVKGLDHFETPWTRTRIVEYHQVFGQDEQLQSLRCSLTAAMAYICLYNFTDARDRLYSLSGLVRDAHLAGIPDLDQDVEDLYKKFVKAFVEHYKSLDVICYATSFTSSESRPGQCRPLPSWVPDWTVPAPAVVGPLMASQPNGPIGNLRPTHSLESSAIYNASLGAKADVVFSDDLKQLSCPGFIIDEVDALASFPAIPPVTRLEFDTLHQGESDILRTDSPGGKPNHDEAAEVMESVMRCLVLDRGDKYFNHAPPTAMFASEFKTFLGLGLQKNPALKFTFKAWFRENRTLRIRGWTLENLAREYVGDDFHPTADQQQGHRGSFFGRLYDTIGYMMRRLIITRMGIICMAPGKTRRGDLVCVLLGCNIPVVLRPAEDGKYALVGECYVDGFMNGEVLSAPRREWRKQVFDII